MTSADVIDLVKEYGPAVMTVIGSVASVIFSWLLWLVRFLWKKHKAQTKHLRDSIVEIGKLFSEYKDASTTEHAKIKETMTAYRAELHLLKVTVEPLKAGILSLEGAVKNQNDTINRYIEKMGVVQGKLDAVFKFIDAPNRSTDLNGK